VRCRHASIVGYFGQQLASANCGACDVCLGEMDLVEDGLLLAQKIVSCVARLNEGYGGDYTAQVLAGSRDQRILDRGHQRLSTWGLLSAFDKVTIRTWIDQLVDQGYLSKGGEFNLLGLTDAGRELLRGEGSPRLLKPARRMRGESRASHDSWDGVDRGLFETLRGFRRHQAEERGIAPFIVFNDATLRDLSRRRPSTLNALRKIRGIGEKKCAEYGYELLREIEEYCLRTGAARDVQATLS
jgi:ATP-dependent DNA helicase RecQ